MKVPLKPTPALAGGSVSGSLAESVARMATPKAQEDLRQFRADEKSRDDAALVDVEAKDGTLVKVLKDGRRIPILRLPKQSQGGVINIQYSS